MATANQDLLILVDGEDRSLGTATRTACHAPGGLLHRAFSVYLFDRIGRLVVQRRQASKQLWPLYWSNSCCSHPRKGEDVAAAARRRVREELGVDVPLTQAFHYQYRADFGAVGTEHEVVHVFLGRVDALELAPNPEEVAELRLLARAELEVELADPARTTPWFRIAWPRLCAEGWIDAAGPCVREGGR